MPGAGIAGSAGEPLGMPAAPLVPSAALPLLAPYTVDVGSSGLGPPHAAAAAHRAATTIKVIDLFMGVYLSPLNRRR